jgi:nitrogen fixation protein NifB
MDKVEVMDVDYEQAMHKRAEYQAEIEAKREAQKQQANETFIPLSTLTKRKKETRPVLMAVATSGGGIINQHFGHAKEFLVYEASMTDVRFIGHRKVDLYCSGGDTCGDAETTLQKTIRVLEGCEAVLCSKIGYEPWEMLEEAGIQPNGEHAMELIEEAIAKVYAEMADNGQLEQPNQLEQLQAGA